MTTDARKQRKGNRAGRSRARRMALQATYQWLMNDEDPKDIVDQFLASDANDNFDQDYFRKLFIDAVLAESEIFSAVADWLDRPLVQIDPVEKSVLQVSCYEMKYHKDVPYKVIINEAVELTKSFGAKDSHKFINAVMDKAAATWRNEDLQAGGK